ncbi:PREDICTED: G-type lectin S-receptor-like serine/threonine-protein kinase At1g11410 isoform X2 [Prunus mume]|uniref:Receptor-like serine/threonine-protein kinase n=1 Tax=Prunus mume TaxID=102107 RepID=A0ABM0P7E0_PRUMU|nr:PREDICTED: G-type lectin S-receptor-like serine/threonine-protein kinase At1g11410 isoform X2 [Prunus mume]
MISTKWFAMNILLLNFLPILPSSTSIVIGSIKPNQPMRDGDVLLSSTKIFALGFFSPANSRNRYVGVWYNKVPNQTIVWVANRNNPIIPVTDNNASGVGLLAVHGNGGLVIYGKDQNTPLWSANVSVSSPNNSMTAKLWDTGNLVLFEEDNGLSQRVLWQGFDHPTNTLLSFMKLGLDRRSKLNWFLTSWKSKDDPGTGNYSYRIDPSGFPQAFLYKGQAPRWRAGPWTGEGWSGVRQTRNDFLFNISFVNNQDEVSLVYGIMYKSISSRIVLDESGAVAWSVWHDERQQWIKYWSAPEEFCDEYGKCGANSNCDPSNMGKFECTCLPGYEPKSPRDWYLRDGSGGCVRNNGVSICGNGDGFMKVERVKVPDSSKALVSMNLSWKACPHECLRNCSCKAYAKADERWGGFGCVTWHGDLMDTRTFSNAGQDLYVRVDANVLAQYAKSNGSLSKKGKLAISLVSVLVFLLLVVPVSYWLVRRKRKGKQRQNKYSPRVTTRSTYFEDSTAELDESSMHSDIPFFDLTTIAAATDNFSLANKLGKGGFGSVYKGVLCNGKEVAVKRLSKHSGQGIDEFKNEIVLIAKLQHRNLVRILGYCFQDEEKMLIYEYVPNKSLDSFIFNDTKRALLDWTVRFGIIYGIARGILYLHQDSRLRIIHRDLKASNVLLDASMNPKISDFGMARIFRGDKSEANTNRVVGTYGYMSPEYAMGGHFSVKSDVYSFGVILLEIVTGRKNSGYYHDKYPDANLVGHVWNLWREGRVLEIVDPSLGELYPVNEVVRCIQIALLCVQEYATDRPTMSAVVFMLGNYDAAVPSPRQPAFLLQRTYAARDPSTNTEGAKSMNDVTCTSVQAR